MKRYAVRYARCGLCGARRPRRELKITMVAEPLWPPHGPKYYGRECRAGHSLRQKRRATDRFLRELFESGYR